MVMIHVMVLWIVTVWWMCTNSAENTLSLKMEAVCVSETVVCIYHMTAVFNNLKVHAVNLTAGTVTSRRAAMNIMPCRVVNTVWLPMFRGITLRFIMDRMTMKMIAL